MEAAKRELQTKLTQLQMTRDKTETVLTRKKTATASNDSYSRYKLLETQQMKRGEN